MLLNTKSACLLDNATAAAMRGGGVEPVDRYGGTKLTFAGLEHAYVVREYFNRLLEGTDQSVLR